MAHHSIHVESSISSSESSEDEEEARKIREALCDESIYNTSKIISIYQSPSAIQIKSEKTKCGPLQVEGKKTSTLKSNRNVDKNDDLEDDNILQTTPGFRAYVAKQLSNMLDSVLADGIVENVWQAPPSARDKNSSGILLFSDSKTLCTLESKVDTQQQQQSKKDTSDIFKHRKHKLSTSSESSEDEKISACVFSVTDIQKENERLTNLEKQSSVKDNEKVTLETEMYPKLCQLSGNNTLPNGSSVVKKKKKKKKKKNKTKDIKTNDDT